MDSEEFFAQIMTQRKNGKAIGIYSVCSAQELVLEASLEAAVEARTPALIEATANQVNQFGGYTGMRPQDFADNIRNLAKKCGLPEGRLILGGDHLGPLPWKEKPEAAAMRLAAKLVEEYVLAGFTKIHIDTSMHLGDDNAQGPLNLSVCARRGAELCAVAENAWQTRRKTAKDAPAPVYVIGSEVPVAGGPQTQVTSIEVTSAEDCKKSIDSFKSALESHGLSEVWSRVCAFVVQPGVEFVTDNVFHYDSNAARELCKVLDEYPNLVFEGHSTDYQTRPALAQMMADGIAILKVGPALTHALHEGLCMLEEIEQAQLRGSVMMSGFSEALECAMLLDDSNWKNHYHGDGVKQRLARGFSYFDRARYYLQNRQVTDSMHHLLENLRQHPPSLPLLSRFMPIQYRRVRSGQLANTPEALLKDYIRVTVDDYLYASFHCTCMSENNA